MGREEVSNAFVAVAIPDQISGGETNARGKKSDDIHVSIRVVFRIFFVFLSQRLVSNKRSSKLNVHHERSCLQNFDGGCELHCPLTSLARRSALKSTLVHATLTKRLA